MFSFRNRCKWCWMIACINKMLLHQIINSAETNIICVVIQPDNVLKGVSKVSK